MCFVYCLDGGEDALKAIIQSRQKSRAEGMDSFFDSLEEKYSKKPKTSSKGKKTGASGSGPSKKKQKK